MPRHDRSRSRSPQSHSHRSRHHRRRSHSPSHKSHAKPAIASQPPRRLPLGARQLSKHDLDSYRSLFSSYLDIQKGLILEDIPERELRGRWKSFMNKWNRGELPEGWYDPVTKQKADDALADEQQYSRPQEAPREESSEPGSSDDGYGPAPAHRQASKQHAPGPSVPTFADLAEREAILADDRDAARETRREERKQYNKEERERLEEMAPRAEPGTRERQLEKRREAAASAKAFRDTREGGGVAEVDDSELMGSGEGGMAEASRVKAEQERRRSEREIRREEALRARKAEREERLAAQRAKEQTTMDMLKAIAKERYG